MPPKDKGGRNLVFTKATGAGVLAVRSVFNIRFRLLRVELHLSAAPTTSGDLTITSRLRESTVYDTVLYKRDLSVGSVTDLVIPFGEGYEYDKDDEVDIDYANADARTFGLRMVCKLLLEE